VRHFRSDASTACRSKPAWRIVAGTLAAALVDLSASPNVMRYGGNSSSKVRAACMSAVAKPSVNRS
jgi:hypothetical protein